MNFGILSILWKLFSPTRASRSSSSGDLNSLQRLCSSQAQESFGAESPTVNHFAAYSGLNDQLLRCIMTGKSESDEAEFIRDQMDYHWRRMSLTEQELMRAHNEKTLNS